MQGDTLTVLTTAGPRLTKVWDNGKINGYEKAKQVAVQERHVDGIFQLSELLDVLDGEPNSCIIRGKFIGHAEAKKLYPGIIESDKRKGNTTTAPKEGFTLRRKEIFADRPLHYCMFDIDGYKVQGGVDPVAAPEEAIDQYIQACLPECFQGVTYRWQLSSGAGHADNVGTLKAHVWFWLTTPYLGADLEAWVHGSKLEIDPSVFRQVQPNYTAAPKFINGAVDPVPVRSGLCQGFFSDAVDLVIAPGVIEKAKVEHKSRSEMVDPSEKEGVIGLFHRTFDIEEVVSRWLPDVFEFADDWRLTFLQSSSGAPEGAGVTQNRHGIFNTHASDPFHGRAANKWDLVRHYVFGHLDDGLDEDEKMLLGPGGWPSQAAMVEMVNALPEIRQEKFSACDTALATHQAAIEAAADQNALRDIAGRIATDGAIDRLAKDMLVETMRDKFAAVTGGKKPSLVAVRELVGMGKRKKTVSSDAAPDWIQGWAYVTSLAKFFNIGSKELISKDAFDSAFCRMVPPDADGNVASAAKLACDAWQIPIAYNIMYLPSAGDFFTVDGQDYVNSYRPESVPVAAVGDPLVSVLMKHVELVIPNPTYRGWFLQWAAWIVRNPGKKVLWATFIKGVEGDGKSVLGSMMAVAMGFENVGIISPETLSGSTFNDWAAGRCLNVLEELKMQGHNRHDVYNKVKPLITNPRIEIHGKGKAAMTAVNTCNYIGFSNHADALPLDKHDRRQFVLFTPWGSIDGMHRMMLEKGFNPEAYWEQLWDVVKNRPDVVRQFFDEVDLAGFNPHGRAPSTHFKDTVVSIGASDEEQAARELIAAGNVEGIREKAISSGCLTSALEMGDPPLCLNTVQVKKLLMKLGFLPVEKPIKWKGKTHRIWLHAEVTKEVTSLTTEEMRSLLDGASDDFL